MPTHLAAVLPSPGQPLTVQARPTPKPGPNDLLIAVKSIALNPADFIMRGDKNGQFIPPARFNTPTATELDSDTNSASGDEVILGFDLSGLVLEVGANVPPTAKFQPGKSRIAAYAASFWRSWDAGYGAFQEKCLVPWQFCVILPDNISFNDGAVIPVAVCVALNAWELLGLKLSGSLTDNGLDIASDKTRHHEGARGTRNQNSSNASDDTTKKQRDKNKSEIKLKEALLIWGASSSVGTMGVQTAVLLRNQGQIEAVYATAGPANTEYVKSLGANRIWDYKDAYLLEKILASAKQDGVVVGRVFLAKGDFRMCQAVLGLFAPEIHAGDSPPGTREKENNGDDKVQVPGPVWGKIASAPPTPAQDEVDNRASQRWGKVETVFITPSMDEETRLGQFRSWTGKWLTENLEKGMIRPSPRVKIVGKGLGAINEGLEMLKSGVSCCKLVVEIDN